MFVFSKTKCLRFLLFSSSNDLNGGPTYYCHFRLFIIERNKNESRAYIPIGQEEKSLSKIFLILKEIADLRVDCKNINSALLIM